MVFNEKCLYNIHYTTNTYISYTCYMYTTFIRMAIVTEALSTSDTKILLLSVSDRLRSAHLSAGVDLQ